MLTRGYLIGQIVDDLTSIATEARQRGRLHLFDLHTHVENFAKEVLNRTLHLSLVNLNAERLNAPGLDLGDASSGWGFQITADKTTAKAKATLEAITDAHRAAFPEVRILVIGEKQGSYTFTGEPFASFGFTPAMMWDFNDICAKIVHLPIDDLIDLQRYVSAETQRVRIELEVADADGRYATDIERHVEALPKPRLSDGARLLAYYAAKGEAVDEPDEVQRSIADLSAKLSRVPRMTRQVFQLLIERRDEELHGMYDLYRIADPKLRRIYRGDDLDGDLQLLEQAKLIDLSEVETGNDLLFWTIRFPGAKVIAFHLLFVEYAEARGIDLRKPLVSLDFSDY